MIGSKNRQNLWDFIESIVLSWNNTEIKLNLKVLTLLFYFELYNQHSYNQHVKDYLNIEYTDKKADTEFFPERDYFLNKENCKFSFYN